MRECLIHTHYVNLSMTYMVCQHAQDCDINSVYVCRNQIKNKKSESEYDIHGI